MLKHSVRLPEHCFQFKYLEFYSNKQTFNVGCAYYCQLMFLFVCLFFVVVYFFFFFGGGGFEDLYYILFYFLVNQKGQKAPLSQSMAHFLN